MKYLLAYSALFAAVVAIPTGDLGQKTCKSEETVVCKGDGEGGFLSLGNLLAGLLGENCSAGDIYCCETGKVQQSGLINIDLNLQCTLNRIL
ncbi:uncharacterized protein N7498_006411 [Penicillium cinerascens]|uniref:Hydrophobin n=1 Tax=Penicillium cinerascens TaxID=70096 RepID=A0A9W9MI67_9EURO|nr:uncharacterized protein N7498_006411 [Penicillium cinerascens]KAJ5201748.1 hypothetical protein N7498_006411 [Penicillium cinerascens]